MEKNEKGITLIALVVTIIVLLILAGITINTLSDNNGIINKAIESKRITEENSILEKINLDILASIDKYNKLNKDKLIDYLEKDGITVTDDKFPLTVSIDGVSYSISDKGKTEKLRPQIEIFEKKVVANSDGTGDNVADNSKQQGTDILYISFKAKIKDGNISSVTYMETEENSITITPQNGIYILEVSANGDYSFNIVADYNGESIEDTFSYSVSKFKIRAGINVGDYIKYTPDVDSDTYSKDLLSSKYSGHTNNKQDIKQENTLAWRVLKIYDNGDMDIIANPTRATVGFGTATGYNNGVYILNDICKKLYSNNEHGIEARSVNLKDFEENMSEDGITQRDDYNKTSNTEVQYGKTNFEKWEKTHTTNKNYPNIYANENGSGIKSTTVKTDGIDDINSYNLDLKPDENGESYTAYKKEQSTGLTSMQTFYKIEISQSYFGAASSILATASNNIYWVASRCVNCRSSIIDFDLRCGSNYLDKKSIFSSNAAGACNVASIRPVITLKSNVKVSVSDKASLGYEKGHTIDW